MNFRQIFDYLKMKRVSVKVFLKFYNKTDLKIKTLFKHILERLIKNQKLKSKDSQSVLFKIQFGLN